MLNEIFLEGNWILNFWNSYIFKVDWKMTQKQRKSFLHEQSYFGLCFSEVSLRALNNIPLNLHFDEVTENALFFSFDWGWKSECSQLGPDWILTEYRQLICTQLIKFWIVKFKHGWNRNYCRRTQHFNFRWILQFSFSQAYLKACSMDYELNRFLDISPVWPSSSTLSRKPRLWIVQLFPLYHAELPQPAISCA